MSTLPKFDVLAFGSHPDDVELCAGGTLAGMVRQGYRTGIVDLTAGELGSRGTIELRASEAAEAARILGASRRVNLGIPDGQIDNTSDNRLKVIRELRATRPDLILIPAPDCRHPDHPAGARLVADAVFQSGLVKIESFDDEGVQQDVWRPHHVLHYMQSIEFVPTLVVDVSETWADRTRAVQAFSSQVFNPDYIAETDEPETFISNPAFMQWWEARAKNFGYRIGATYGEPFLYRHGPMGTDDLIGMLKKQKPFR
ncbi:MAG: bacillithiol biosynthesis deacetylase BshB1 [Bacteroidetes Order II. Incertae sedis bacterium]|jgi:N-acetylglucosamine malate deacetylase 1|nr:bacillithiol biosynthesis deacetylase BshB1 [Bacteroidetes Order II. bacterium]MBT5249954.1 bacillithiol biosynthesis deacetylase BshB1 [Bacteroidetes Order II. bacterium]MBT6200632.1 bacillithiol biosynthesis deacetylase BshB1 [Bacteroidetes Order II. bacterium]MBT6425115.1 bacillithiol biosynthesis deacetylase BshB1 [Bacteroidetes Order II. bacterium]MBT6582413.1 bacillithiol biosynthesis deacetylase BshB1 [Bacteroidetes Order II. bacterium]